MGNNLLLEKFMRIEFGKRVFYMPHCPANMYIDNNCLTIDLADMNHYILVNGIRCYYQMVYNVETDIVSAWLTDYMFDGIPVADGVKTCFDFSFEAHDFMYSKSVKQIVTPKRDYSEVTNAFLEEFTELDPKIVTFLRNHPNAIQQTNIEPRENLTTCWLNFNEYLKKTDEELDLSVSTIAEWTNLSKDVAKLFCLEYSL